MKIRVVLTVDVPPKEMPGLRKRFGDLPHIRDHFREEAWRAVKRLDWIQDLEADVTREN